MLFLSHIHLPSNVCWQCLLCFFAVSRSLLSPYAAGADSLLGFAAVVTGANSTVPAYILPSSQSDVNFKKRLLLVNICFFDFNNSKHFLHL
jgi:hypothetical protein